jgi:hypothetical protein
LVLNSYWFGLNSFNAITADTPQEAITYVGAAAGNILGLALTPLGGGFTGFGGAIAGQGSIASVISYRTIGAVALPVMQNIIYLSSANGGGGDGSDLSQGGGDSYNVSVKDVHVNVPKHKLNKLASSWDEQKKMLINTVKNVMGQPSAPRPTATSRAGSIYEISTNVTTVSGNTEVLTIRFFLYKGSDDIVINTAFIP